MFDHLQAVVFIPAADQQPVIPRQMRSVFLPSNADFMETGPHTCWFPESVNSVFHYYCNDFAQHANKWFKDLAHLPYGSSVLNVLGGGFIML